MFPSAHPLIDPLFTYYQYMDIPNKILPMTGGKEKKKRKETQFVSWNSICSTRPTIDQTQDGHPSNESRLVC